MFEVYGTADHEAIMRRASATALGVPRTMTVLLRASPATFAPPSPACASACTSVPLRKNFGSSLYSVACSAVRA